MKTVTILKNDLVLNKIILVCITCDDNSVKSVIAVETKRLQSDIKEGWIDSNFRIEVIDKINTYQFIV